MLFQRHQKKKKWLFQHLPFLLNISLYLETHIIEVKLVVTYFKLKMLFLTVQSLFLFLRIARKTRKYDFLRQFQIYKSQFRLFSSVLCFFPIAELVKSIKLNIWNWIDTLYKHLFLSKEENTWAKLLMPTVPTLPSTRTHSCLSVNFRAGKNKRIYKIKINRTIH